MVSLFKYLLMVIGISSSVYAAGHRSRLNGARIRTQVHSTKDDLIGADFFDMQPGKKVAYLYAPGLMGSAIQMGRYNPCFMAHTGEKVIFKRGGHVIGKPYASVQFCEIDLRKPGGFTLNPLKAIMDDIRKDLFPVARRLWQDSWEFDVIECPKAHDSVLNYNFSFGVANVGQKRDIRTLKVTYDEMRKCYPDYQLVLYGDSRGAATIFNFLARYNPSGIGGAVLEGVFDTVEHCIEHFLYDDKEVATKQRLHGLFSFVMGGYSKKGPFPLDMVNKIPLDIPLLFVTSLKDGLVGAQPSFNLYQRLRQRGHQRVHLLVLKTPYHPSYMLDNQAEKVVYENTVHAFYRHYGLPHNKARAQAGADSFLQTQPEINGLFAKHNLMQCNVCSLKV